MSESSRQPVQSSERDNHTLPSWIYSDARFAALEREKLLPNAWYLACHVNEIAQSGDYITLKYLGERIAVARLQDGRITAFHNTCKHRAHQVITGESGNCKRAHVCPYHGWTYAEDGAIRGIPGGSAEDLTQVGRGLQSVDVEVCVGFVWIRLQSGGPSMAERLGPLMELLKAYRIEEMQVDDDLSVETHAIDWKNMMDNYLEGYHVAIGHPGLNKMVEPEYDVSVDAERGTVFATHLLKQQPIGEIDEFTYLSVRPINIDLPADHGRRWSYLTIFPNINIGLTPEGVDYFVFNPEGAGRATFRTRGAYLPNPSPAVRAARAATWRIWDQVQAEDTQLTDSVQRGLESGSYRYGYLSPREAGVRAFRDWLRERLPVARQEDRPAVDVLRLS